MNLLLFIMTFLVSFAVVRIGAVAFQLTGLDWSLAKFQSLSCFTGTGFTTKEAELITGSPQRRRIATILMILGHAGLVAMIATFANSIDPDSISAGIQIPFLSSVLPATILAVINLAVIIAVIYIIFRAFTHTRLARQTTEYIRKRVIKREMVIPVSFEELAVLTGGYGVSKIKIAAKSLFLDRTLAQSNLKSRGIMVLALARSGETMPNPPAHTKILLDDDLVCFGTLDNIRAVSKMTASDTKNGAPPDKAPLGEQSP